MENKIAMLFLFVSTIVLASVPPVEFEQRVGTQLPLQTLLINEHGEVRALASYLGDKPVILSFVYYGCPNLCTLVLNGLATSVLDEDLKAGRDFNLLSISIDPKEKPSLSLAKKRTYLARINQTSDDNPTWHFLTASQSSIESLTDASGFHFRYDPNSGEFNHPSGIIILTPKGVISRYFFGIRFDPKELKSAIQDATAGNTHKTLSEIILNCFHYNPQTGKYGSFIISLLQWVSILAVAAIIGLLAYLSLAPKRAAHE